MEGSVTKKTATKGAAAKKPAGKKTVSAKRTAAKPAPKSMPKEGRNPKGGLTQKGRDFFAKRDGLHLKPGVTGPADTPEKMLRKGSFLVRTFTHPRGPMIDPKGEPTRLALSAHAWGEKVPKTVSEAHLIAAKGHQLLSKYHAEKDKAKAAGKPPAAKKGVAAKRARVERKAGQKKPAATKQG